jgi:hypothetical protein
MNEPQITWHPQAKGQLTARVGKLKIRLKNAGDWEASLTMKGKQFLPDIYIGPGFWDREGAKAKAMHILSPLIRMACVAYEKEAGGISLPPRQEEPTVEVFVEFPPGTSAPLIVGKVDG